MSESVVVNGTTCAAHEHGEVKHQLHSPFSYAVQKEVRPRLPSSEDFGRQLSSPAPLQRLHCPRPGRGDISVVSILRGKVRYFLSGKADPACDELLPCHAPVLVCFRLFVVPSKLCPWQTCMVCSKQSPCSPRECAAGGEK